MQIPNAVTVYNRNDFIIKLHDYAPALRMAACRREIHMLAHRDTKGQRLHREAALYHLTQSVAAETGRVNAPAEVCDLQVATTIQEQVFRLDAAVNDLLQPMAINQSMS